MNEIKDIINLIISSGIIGVSVLLFIRILIYIAKNPDLILKWSEIYIKYIGFWESNRKRKIVAAEIDHRVTKIANKINKESFGILPFGLKIKWIKNQKQNEDVTVYNNDVILVLKESPNIDKNVVDACMLFTPKALLPKARESCDANLLHNIDLYTIKKMLTIGNYTSAYNYFIKNIIENGISDGTIDKQDIETLELSDDKGLYSRIILEELKIFGESIYGTFEEKKYISDSIDFYNFMKVIVNRRPGDNTRLLYIGSRIKVGIIFVAKRKTLDSYYGLDSYTHRVKLDFENGAQRVYIMGYKVFREESEVDPDGFVINVVKHASFRYLDEIEKKLENDMNYVVKMSEKYPIKIQNKSRFVKLLTIEQRANSM